MSSFTPVQIVRKKEAYAPIATMLVAFEKREQNLLNKLQLAYKRGPRSKPFDAARSSADLAQLARLYFWGKVRKQGALPLRDRKKRLREFARALRQAHGVAERALRDEVGSDLYRAFVAETYEIKTALAAPLEKDGSSLLVRAAGELKEMVAALATLEKVATAAANDVPRNTGRPPLLSRDCIQGLARMYRNSTGLKPGRGPGPFAEFVSEFLIAVGQTKFEYESIIDAIKDAHGKLNPSHFYG